MTEISITVKELRKLNHVPGSTRQYLAQKAGIPVEFLSVVHEGWAGETESSTLETLYIVRDIREQLALPRGWGGVVSGAE